MAANTVQNIYTVIINISEIINQDLISFMNCFSILYELYYISLLDIYIAINLM